MKILFVSCTMPPEGTATSSIIKKLMDQLAKKHEIEGLTFKNKISDSDFYLVDNIPIYRANYVRNYGYKSQTISDYLFKIKRKIIDSFYNNQYPFREYATRKLVQMLYKIDAAQSYDAIISVAAFYDSVEAVLRYKKKVKGKAHYFFYQVDPLEENEAFEYIDRQWLSNYEKKIYSSFHYIFSTREIIELKKGKNWNLNNAMVLNYPCVDFRLYDSVRQEQDNQIRCVYAGQLNEKIRDGTFILNLFLHLDIPSFSLYIMGSGQEELLSEIREKSKNNWLHILGEKTDTECNEVLSSADFLLIIGNNTMNQVPSKIFSYRSFGIPIIATCKSEDCPSIKYLEEIPNALIINEQSEDLSKLSNKVNTFIKENLHSRLSLSEVKRINFEYTPFFVSEQMINKIEFIISSDKKEVNYFG